MSPMVALCERRRAHGRVCDSDSKRFCHVSPRSFSGTMGLVASVGTFGVCDLGSLFWQDGLFRRHPSSCFGGAAPSSSLAQSLNRCHRATIVDPSWVTNLWQFQDPNYGILEISFSLNLMH